MNSAPLRYAVFGAPVAHSLSPRIHAAFAAQFGIDLEYHAIEVVPAEFPAVLQRFHAEGGAGANVTLPLKELAAALVEGVDGAARRAGAVNTLLRTERGWQGANTDGAGLVADLRSCGVRLLGAEVVMLGAGGAVRGIVGPLLDGGVQSIRIVNRDLGRAQAIVAAFADGRLSAVERGNPGGVADLLINATSAGHAGHSVAWPAGLCDGRTVAYDLSYGPAARSFLDWARSAGTHLALDGLGMLVGQAAEAFCLWHGVRPDVAQVLAALRRRAAEAR